MLFFSIHSFFSINAFSRFYPWAYIASKTANLATSISAHLAASYGGGEVF